MDMRQKCVPSGSVLKPVLFSTFIIGVVVGVCSAISKSAAGTKVSQKAKCHASGKELQKDLGKLSVRVKGGKGVPMQINTNECVWK